MDDGQTDINIVSEEQAGVREEGVAAVREEGAAAGQGPYGASPGYYRNTKNTEGDGTFPDARQKRFSLPHRIWRIIYPALLFLSINFAVGIIAGVISSVSILVQEFSSGSTQVDEGAILESLSTFLFKNAILITLIYQIICLFVFIPMWHFTRKRLEPVKNTGFPIILALSLCFFAGFNIIQAVIFELTNILEYFPSYGEFSELIMGAPFIIQLLSVGLAAPIVEELVFRGILMERMKWLPVWASVLIQAALFGAAHLNLFQGMYAFIVGVVLGLAYIKYRSIILVIAGHLAFNMTSLLLSELAPEESQWFNLVIIGLSVVSVIACGIMLIKRKGAQVRIVDAEVDAVNEERLVT